MSLYTVEEGDRVELVSTDDEYTALEPGDTGTVRGYSVVRAGPNPTPKRKVHIAWDSGSTLALIAGVDTARKIADDDSTNEDSIS